MESGGLVISMLRTGGSTHIATRKDYAITIPTDNVLHPSSDYMDLGIDNGNFGGKTAVPKDWHYRHSLRNCQFHGRIELENLTRAFDVHEVGILLRLSSCAHCKSSMRRSDAKKLIKKFAI